MALQDTSTLSKREIYKLYQAEELSESKAREIIGNDWNACVTGTMMEKDLDNADWDSLYADESVQ